MAIPERRKTMKLTLPSGTTYGYGADGQRVCTGSAMGRRNRIPSDRTIDAKLHLQLLPFVDGCYDRWGAYWGFPANVWIAFTDYSVAFGDSLQTIEFFFRANSREEAKAKALLELPKARFYR